MHYQKVLMAENNATATMRSVSGEWFAMAAIIAEESFWTVATTFETACQSANSDVWLAPPNHQVTRIHICIVVEIEDVSIEG